MNTSHSQRKLEATRIALGFSLVEVAAALHSDPDTIRGYERDWFEPGEKVGPVYARNVERYCGWLTQRAFDAARPDLLHTKGELAADLFAPVAAEPEAPHGC